MRAAPSADKESKAGEMGGAMLASFRHKLAVYFLLLAVAPLTAAFWGFGTITKRAEERRAGSPPRAPTRAPSPSRRKARQHIDGTAPAASPRRGTQRRARLLCVSERRPPVA